MLHTLLKHLAGKHNQKLHGRAGNGISNSAAIIDDAALNEVRVKRDTVRQKLLEAESTARISPAHKESDIRFIMDTAKDPVVRNAAANALALRMELRAADAEVETTTEQYVAKKLQDGTMPQYNLEELYKQQYANRNSPDKLAIINNQIQESKYASLIAQRTDGIDHTTITRSPIALSDYLNMGAKLLAVDDMNESGRNANGTFHSDLIQDHINKQLGLDASPQLLNRAEMDAMVASGARELFRGVMTDTLAKKTAGQLTDEFMRGEFYAGVGVFGNGTYVGYGPERVAANAYSDVTEGQGVLRMALKPQARVITTKTLLQLHQNYTNRLPKDITALDDAITKKYDDMRDAGTATVADSAILDKKLTDLMHFSHDYHRLVLGDPGRYAALAGYDAIDVESGYMVVLNRSAVAADITSYDDVP